MIKIYKNSATPEPILSELSEVLRQGELLIIPTDTRYSLCCDALNPSSVGRLAQLKGIDPYKNTSLSFAVISHKPANMFALMMRLLSCLKRIRLDHLPLFYHQVARCLSCIKVARR